MCPPLKLVSALEKVRDIALKDEKEIALQKIRRAKKQAAQAARNLAEAQEGGAVVNDSHASHAAAPGSALPQPEREGPASAAEVLGGNNINTMAPHDQPLVPGVPASASPVGGAAVLRFFLSRSVCFCFLETPAPKIS